MEENATYYCMKGVYKQFCSKYAQLDRPVYVIYTFINFSTTINDSLLQSVFSPIIAYGY